MTQEKRFCFCSLAFGKNYRNLALLLAKDIEKYSPNTYFIVLTDFPQDFNKQPNVIALKHKQQSVKLYQDKRFAIAHSLSMFNSCIFLDADMRILAPVPQDMAWLQTPGISARSCETMSRKYAKVVNNTGDANLARGFKVTKKAAQKLNLDMDSPDVKFVYEYLFAVTKDSGRELDFLKQWEIIAPYFELNGVYDGEGNTIGLAAAKADFPVRWNEMQGISFFKDKSEMIRIQKGQSNMEQMSEYFKQQRMFEYPHRSLWEKIILKLNKQIVYLNKFILLRIMTLKRFSFYYR